MEPGGFKAVASGLLPRYKPQSSATVQPLPLAPPAPTPARASALLALAGFSGQAMVRAADSVLPQIAADIGTSVGAASIVVTAYAITHGSVQLIIGPVGDKFGKFLSV